MSDQTEFLVEGVRAAIAARTPWRIVGGGSKDFYGSWRSGEVLHTGTHSGIVSYEPTELVVTARAGTPLAELEAVLAEERQMLAFEPPHFGAGATVGGCVAAGLSGPRRLAAGAVRDFVLGVKMVDGQGEALRFGGQVMKNVAGYDVSRLMAGSLGTLGLLLEVSLKVLPRPMAETSVRWWMDEATFIARANQWAGEPLPISATAWCDGQCTLRLSGAAAAVRAARQRLGGQELDPAEAADFWRTLREHQHAFFAGSQPLWRLAVPGTTPALGLPGAGLIEWSGGLRWLRTEASADHVRVAAQAAGGHATLFRGGEPSVARFQPALGALAALQHRVKAALDPAGVFASRDVPA